MQNVVLVIHLILALALIGVVLLQRSEGGGLGIGGGMGPQAGRPPLTGLAKLTWGFAIAFIGTSIALTAIGSGTSSDSSVLDGVELTPGAEGTTQDVDLPDVQLPTDVQLPPAGDAPLVPPRQD